LRRIRDRERRAKRCERKTKVKIGGWCGQKNPMEWWDVDGKKADGTLVEVEYGTPLFFLSSRDDLGMFFVNTDN
jgi:hypothetical protein